MPQSKLNLSPAKEPFDPGEEARADIFAGSPIFTFHTIVFLAFTGFLIVLTNSPGKLTPQQDTILLTAGILGMYLFTGIQMFYFKVSDRTLIVRNHDLPWIRWHYNIKEISKTAIHRYYKTATGLTFKIADRPLYRVFPAGSLRKKHWKALQQRLEGIGVPVADRAYL